MKLYREPKSNEYKESTPTIGEKGARHLMESLRKDIKELEHRLAAAEKRCDHGLFWDDPGFAYTVRKCWICQIPLEFIWEFI